jgi:cellulose biosynthesis protein BcsQ
MPYHFYRQPKPHLVIDGQKWELTVEGVRQFTLERDISKLDGRSVRPLIKKGWAFQPSEKEVLDRAASHQTKMLSIYNYKGGIGKSSFAVLLALYLAANHRKVLLVDADPQSTSTLLLSSPEDWNRWSNARPAENIYDIFEPLVNSRKKKHLGKCPTHVIHNVGENIDLLPGDLRVAEVEMQATIGVHGHEDDILSGNYLDRIDAWRTLQGVEDYAKERCIDYVLFDCSPAFTLPTIVALMASRYIICPISNEIATGYGVWLCNQMLGKLITSLRVRVGEEVLPPQPAFIRWLIPYNYRPDESAGMASLAEWTLHNINGEKHIGPDDATILPGITSDDEVRKALQDANPKLALSNPKLQVQLREIALAIESSYKF